MLHIILPFLTKVIKITAKYTMYCMHGTFDGDFNFGSGFNLVV